MLCLPEEQELAIRTSAGRLLLVGSDQIAEKATRDSQGVAVVTLKKNQATTPVRPAAGLDPAAPPPHRPRRPPPGGRLGRQFQQTPPLPARPRRGEP